MKRILFPLMLTAGLSYPAMANNYTLCNTSGCKDGGNTWTYSDYAKTKYPIVLAHGLGGFSEIAGINYWYGIPQSLTANGGNVFVTQVASAQSSEVRGEQLLQRDSGSRKASPSSAGSGNSPAKRPGNTGKA